jgi:hypothetical protein
MIYFTKFFQEVQLSYNVFVKQFDCYYKLRIKSVCIYFQLGTIDCRWLGKFPFNISAVYFPSLKTIYAYVCLSMS